MTRLRSLDRKNKSWWLGDERITLRKEKGKETATEEYNEGMGEGNDYKEQGRGKGTYTRGEVGPCRC